MLRLRHLRLRRRQQRRLGVLDDEAGAERRRLHGEPVSRLQMQHVDDHRPAAGSLQASTTGAAGPLL